jgi:cysteine desulfurase
VTPPRIYLDANATTPLDPRVRAAMEPFLGCGNASSPHLEGRTARAAIDRAREQVAALVRATPREIVFTSGGTEANALALLGTIAAQGVRRVLTSAVEHPSVLRTLEALRPGVDVVVAPVDREARVAADLPIPGGTALVSIMVANNETGTLQPVAEIAARARNAGAVMHADAVQACGKVPVDVHALGVDLLSMSAHKIHGPKGAGALFVRRGVRLAPLYHGGEHERALRPGTENVAAIVGFGAAAELAARELEERARRFERLSRLLLDGVRAAVPGVLVNSPERGRVPNTLNFTIPGAEGEAVLLGLDLEGIAIATGSACSSGAAEPSHVLQAMGRSRVEAEQSVRVSLHANSTEADVNACVNALARVVKQLRALHV